MQCIFCLGARAPQSELKNINDNKDCTYEEYLKICKKYLTVDLVNVEIKKSPEGYLPVCSVCFCSVDQLYKIHKELQEIETKLLEFSNTFSQILTSCRSKIENTGDDNVTTGKAIKSEVSESEDNDVSLEHNDDNDENNALFHETDDDVHEEIDAENPHSPIDHSHKNFQKKVAPKDKPEDWVVEESMLECVLKEELSDNDKEEISESEDLFGSWNSSEKLPSQEELDVHSTSHLTENKKIACETCGKKFNTLKFLKVHEKIHSSSLQCQDCKKKFTHVVYLNRHKIGNSCIKKPRGRNHQCDQCEKSYLRSSHLLHHKKMTHNLNNKKGSLPKKQAKKPYFCDDCGTTVLSKYAFDIHKRVHTGETPFQCDTPDCEMAFRSRELLKYHKATHNNDYPHVCPHDLCEKRFKIKSQLKQHCELSHPSPDTLYVCPDCGKTFKTKRKLTEHLPDHNDEIKLGCSQCGKKFNTRHKLTMHISYVHEKEHFPFVCDICGTRKPTKSKHEDHMRTHTGEKPFKCSQCNKSFTSKVRMAQHRKEKHH